MALSEHEQRLLDEMERRFYQSEADVMPAASGPRPRLNYRSIVLGVLVTLLGIGVLIGGAAAQQLWLGLLGFVVMIAGVVLFFSRRTDANEVAAEDQSKGSTPAAGQGRESLSDRAERRWNERMEGER